MASYTATQSGDWNTNSTWGGAGHPVAGDTAIINSTYMVTVGTTAACAVVDCTSANGGGGITLNAGLTTTGNVTLVAGMTFTPNTQTWTMGCSSVALASGGKSFYNLTFNVSGTLTLTDALTVTNTMTTSGVAVVFATSDVTTKNLTCTAGTFAGAGRKITISGGVWTASSNGSTVATDVDMTGACTITTRASFKTGTLNATSATLTMSSSDTLVIAGSCTFTDATNTWTNIDCSVTATLTLSQTTTISGALSVATGQTFTLATNNIVVAGGVTLNGSGIITGQTVTMTGGTWIGASTGSLRSNLVFNGNCTISGTVRYRDGTITYTSGTITVISSTLLITHNCTLNTNGMSWNDFSFSLDGARNVTLSSALDVNGSITLSSSTNNNLHFMGSTMTVAGSISVTSGGDMRGSTVVTMDGTGLITTSSTGIIGFSLTINTAGTITVGSSFNYGAVDAGAATFTYTAGTLDITTNSTAVFFGKAGTIANITWTDATHTWKNFTLLYNTNLTLSQSTTISGDLSWGVGRTCSLVSNDLSIQGSLTAPSSGTLSGRTINMIGSGTWSGGAATLQSNLVFNTAGTIVVSGTVTYNTGTITYTAGTMTVTSSTLKITGACALNTSAMSWNNVTFTIASATPNCAITTNLDINGDLTSNGASAVTITTGDITCAGSWYFSNASGAYYSMLGLRTVTMDGTGMLNRTIAGGTCYENMHIVFNTAGIITIDPTNAWYHGGADFSTTGNITYIAGTIVTTGSIFTIGRTCTITDPSDSIKFHTLSIYGGTTVSPTITLTNPITIYYLLATDVRDTLAIATSDLTITNGMNLGIPLSGRTIHLTGGTWTATAATGVVSSNISIEGDVTVSGNVYFSTGTLTYVRGTTTTTSSTLNIRNVNTTLSTNGMTWDNISCTVMNAKTLTLGSALQVSGNLDLTGTTTHTILACGTNNVTIGGNFTNPKGTTGRTGNNTFIFNGTTTIAGATNFYNFTINPGKTVNLTSTQVFTVAGTFNAAGTIGSPITFKAVTGSSAAHFDVTTVGTVTYVNATDIDSATGNTITTTNGSITRTVNWILVIPSTGNPIFFGFDF